MILFPTNGKENIYTSHNCFCKIEAIVHDQIIYRFSSSFFPSLLYTCYVERTFLVAEPAPVVLIWVCHEHCCYFSTTDPSVYMNRECIHVSAVCYYWFWISCCSSTSATDPLGHVGLHLCVRCYCAEKSMAKIWIKDHIVLPLRACKFWTFVKKIMQGQKKNDSCLPRYNFGPGSDSFVGLSEHS